MDDNQFQILGRLQAQARSQSSELDALQTQLVLRQRESKKSQVVTNELNGLVASDKEGLRLYKAFGKAFVLERPQSIIKDYKTADKEANEEAQAIQKKIKWLEKELKNSQTSLQEFYARIQVEEKAS